MAPYSVIAMQTKQKEVEEGKVGGGVSKERCVTICFVSLEVEDWLLVGPRIQSCVQGGHARGSIAAELADWIVGVRRP